jgi:hypothetical protein
MKQQWQRKCNAGGPGYPVPEISKLSAHHHAMWQAGLVDLCTLLGEALPCVEPYIAHRLKTWAGAEDPETKFILALLPFLNPMSSAGMVYSLVLRMLMYAKTKQQRLSQCQPLYRRRGHEAARDQRWGKVRMNRTCGHKAIRSLS